MGREIRRVPPNWEHPRYTDRNARRSQQIGRYIPMYDEDYETAAERWISGFKLWQAGKHPAQARNDIKYFWDYEGMPPEPESYRQKFTEDAIWFQVYETVSEGTPVTPPFKTEDELIDYLVNVGERAGTEYNQKFSREAATSFVKGSHYAPSMVIIRTADNTSVKCGIASCEKDYPL